MRSELILTPDEAENLLARLSVLEGFCCIMVARAGGTITLTRKDAHNVFSELEGKTLNFAPGPDSTTFFITDKTVVTTPSPTVN